MASVLDLRLPLANGKTQEPPSTVGQEWGSNGALEHTWPVATKALKLLLELASLEEYFSQDSPLPPHISIDVSPNPPKAMSILSTATRLK